MLLAGAGLLSILVSLRRRAVLVSVLLHAQPGCWLSRRSHSGNSSFNSSFLHSHNDSDVAAPPSSLYDSSLFVPTVQAAPRSSSRVNPPIQRPSGPSSWQKKCRASWCWAGTPRAIYCLWTRTSTCAWCATPRRDTDARRERTPCCWSGSRPSMFPSILLPEPPRTGRAATSKPCSRSATSGDGQARYTQCSDVRVGQFTGGAQVGVGESVASRRVAGQPQ